jgi:integrase
VACRTSEIRCDADDDGGGLPTIAAILNTAVDDDILVRNPCGPKAAGAEQAPERPVLTIDHVLALSTLVPPWLAAFVLRKAFGGLRWGEITALHRNDVDLELGVLQSRAAYVERSDGALLLSKPKRVLTSACWRFARVRAVTLPGRGVQMTKAPRNNARPSSSERVTRIELALSAWEADVLPLNYTRGPARCYTRAPALRASVMGGHRGGLRSARRQPTRVQHRLPASASRRRGSWSRVLRRCDRSASFVPC